MRYIENERERVRVNLRKIVNSFRKWRDRQRDQHDHHPMFTMRNCSTLIFFVTHILTADEIVFDYRFACLMTKNRFDEMFAVMNHERRATIISNISAHTQHIKIELSVLFALETGAWLAAKMSFSLSMSEGASLVFQQNTRRCVAVSCRHRRKITTWHSLFSFRVIKNASKNSARAIE